MPALDFPNSPTVDQIFSSGGTVWTWDGVKWNGTATSPAFVQKAGDTMTGALTLPADPTAALQAATKQYADLKVAKTGDTMSGDLTVAKTIPQFTLNATGTNDGAFLNWQNAYGNRWSAQMVGAAEPGSNAGSDFALYRYNDAGGAIDAPLSFARNTGKAFFTQSPYLASDPTDVLDAVTKRYADAQAVPNCGRLFWQSPTLISFGPYNGDRVKINGAIYPIPGAPVSAANTNVYINGVAGQNLVANTLYYVYLFNNVGTLTMDFSTTGHGNSITAGNVGTEIKTGDNTRSLIGAIRTNASAQFQNEGTYRGVISWFNRRNLHLLGANTNGATTTSVGNVELTTAGRAYFITWGDEPYHFAILGSAYPSAGSPVLSSGLGLDGSSAFSGGPQVGTATWTNLSAYQPLVMSEGYHYITSMGGCWSAGPGNYFLVATGMIRG